MDGWYNFYVMEKNFEIPRIKLAEVFVDGRCVGLLSNVKLSREEDGGFEVEGEWSGYPDVIGEKESTCTISIPSYECRFLSNLVDTELIEDTGRILFRNASFIPEGPKPWFDKPAEA